MNRSFIFLDIDGPINTDQNKKFQRKLGNSISSYHIHLPAKKFYNLK